MIERRKCVRVDVKNFCEIKLSETSTLIEYGVLKDISLGGFGIMSAEFYNQGDILNTSAMLGGKLILIKGNIVSVHYKTKDYCRYGLELVDVDETTYKIIEEYVSAKIGATWTKKVKKFI